MQLCILFIILSVAYSGFRIQSPTVNNQHYKDQLNITFSLANFGHVPYGKKMNGVLFLPPTNYTESTHTFCNASDVDYTRQYFQHHGDKWLIVKRGECPFTRKAINAQNIGAKLLVIVDNRVEDVDKIVMADDGNGYQVNIPSILISKSEGEFPIGYLEKFINSYLASSIEFTNALFEKPSVIFGLNIEQRDTFRLLKDFRHIYESFGDAITFDIYYEVLRCFSCEHDNWKSKIDDCIGGGRYCQFDPNGANFGDGSDVIKEQLRQTCVWKHNRTLWWDYMTTFSKNCTKPNAYEKCFNDHIPKEEQTSIQKCVKESFAGKDIDYNDVNTILEEHFELRYSTGIIFYPGASINNVSYRGNIEAIDIKEDICAAMIEKHSSCTELVPQTLINRVEPSYFWLIITVVLSSVLFILFIVFIYRRSMKQSMQREIRDQVSEKVSQYVKFYESRSEK